MESIEEISREIHLYDIYIRQVTQTIGVLQTVRDQINSINLYIREVTTAKHILDRNIYSLRQEQQRLIYLKLAQVTHKNILQNNVPAIEYRQC